MKKIYAAIIIIGILIILIAYFSITKEIKFKWDDRDLCTKVCMVPGYCEYKGVLIDMGNYHKALFKLNKKCVDI